MFKQMIELWKGEETLFDEIRDDFQEMLSTGGRMFNLVMDALVKGSEMGSLDKEIYKMDARLNQKEQTIRRKIITLLSGGPEEPIAFQRCGADRGLCQKYSPSF
jgi:phosphate uptake regulator